MNYKPLIIVLGEPRSVFIEILLKAFKKIKVYSIKRPIILIGSTDLLKKQMVFFKTFIKIKNIHFSEIHKVNDNKFINIIDVKLNVNSPFQKKIIGSNKYIEKSFDLAIKILQNNQACGLINGPISKTKFLKGKFLGITEYLTTKSKSKNSCMLIYNKNLSVSPITTHVPIKEVAKKINKKLIVNKILLIENFYKKYLKKPKIAVLGLNPHCETVNKISEEKNFIIPAINKLKSKGINISGPFSADTFFIKANYSKFNLVIGMYHDQVLTPIKSLFGFDAINITIGLPFLRISPDHGPNEKMLSKNKSDPQSLIKSIIFFCNNEI